MRKRTRRWGLLRLLLAFFAGVVVTVYLLVPGRTGPTVLVYRDSRTQLENISGAGERIAHLGNQALSYASQAKDYLRDKIKESK